MPSESEGQIKITQAVAPGGEARVHLLTLDQGDVLTLGAARPLVVVAHVEAFLRVGQ
jgi:hypothetical protein